MKITIEDADIFDLRRISSGLDMAMALWDFQQYLREQVRYRETPDDIHKIYEKWFENLGDNSINLDNLIE